MSGERLRVDPTACDGIGVCSHFAAELVATDTWGYPIVTNAPLNRGQRRKAVAAVKACPRKALFLEAPER
jgi:ferredoxin